MKIPLSFTVYFQELLRESYCCLPKEDIEKIFPQYCWRSIQNIANELGIKRIFQQKRNGDIGILLNKSNESFYWIGMIAADGTVSRDGTLKLDLRISEKYHIEKLAKFINSKVYEYPKYKNSKPGGTGICRVKIKDIIKGVELRELFKIKGCKTYEPISLDFIETDSQFLSFLAGYIDGDGSISKQGYISIDGHKNMSELFTKFANRLNTMYSEGEHKILYYEDMVRLNLKSFYSKRIKKDLGFLGLPLMIRKWDRIT